MAAGCRQLAPVWAWLSTEMFAQARPSPAYAAALAVRCTRFAPAPTCPAVLISTISQALHVCCPPDGYAVLTQLSRLAHLWLKYNDHLPACLPQLTGLQQLMLDESGGAMQLAEAQAAVDAALQQLTGVRA